MLLNVNVKNLALIREADINFSEGLNILTGETGAGKSIIIGSINIALGGKISKEIVREGAAYGLVELVFEIKDENTIKKLNEIDVELEEGNVIISRKISNGRSTIKVNGETKTATELRKITSLLIDVHGQHDHQSLLDESKHLSLIDKFGYDNINPLIEKVKVLYKEYTDIKKELASYDFDEESRARECSFAEFEINEIDNANLRVNEDEELEEEYKKLFNSGKIISSLGNSYTMLESDGRMSACDMIGNAYREIASVSSYDVKISEYADRMAELESLLRDLSSEISDYVDNMEFSEELLDKTEKRLDIINNLKQKYGSTIEDILSYRDERERYLDKLTNLNSEREKLIKSLEEVEKQLEEECNKLTDIRKETALSLETAIVEVLKDLNFMYVDFRAEFEKTASYSANGNDSVCFKITTNPGESLKPLAKVASGGELSRIMLGLKTIMAKQDEIDTLIFDEIDTGISGRTAQLVAEKMNLISRNHQVICITHLPQIAAMADNHYLIDKSIKDNETVTSIEKLNENESIDELVRILGGAKISEAVYAHAGEMKKMALETKLSQS